MIHVFNRGLGRTTAALLGLGLMIGLGHAGPASDLLLAPGVVALDAAKPALHYAHARQLPAPSATAAKNPEGVLPLQPVVDGEVHITKKGSADQLVLSLHEAGKAREIGSFSPAGANPMLLFFLENIVRSAATQTGGSPYYIRNRIKDALLSAELGPIKDGKAEVTLSPFAADPNAARLGDFAGLKVALTFAPDAPGALLALHAETGSGAESYRESLTLLEGP